MARGRSRGTEDRDEAASGPKRPGPFKRALGLPGRLVIRVPWMRRRYARSTMRNIERMRKAGRPLPESLARVDRQLKRLPPHKRQEALEQMMELSSSGDVVESRAVRRAAGRQDRQRGDGRGLRPGSPPTGQRQIRR